jgi:hypothetical protein
VILGAEDVFDADEDVDDREHDPAIRHRGAGTEVPANA